MPRPKTPDLLKPSEVAALLKISKQMVYWYIRRGTIPAGRVKGSRLLRIRRHDLNRAISGWFEPRIAEREERGKKRRDKAAARIADAAAKCDALIAETKAAGPLPGPEPSTPPAPSSEPGPVAGS